MAAAALHPERLARLALVAGLAALLAAAVVGWRALSAGAASPVLTLAPGPSGGSFHDGQTIAVTVSANSVFSPNSRIVIMECAAPNGVLPTDDSTCDGNTVQGDSVLVGGDGSFSEPAYPLYHLPNLALSEQANHLPVCDATHQCVLYVGQDQNDFTKPKVFSVPFALAGSAGSTTPATTTPPAVPVGGAGGTGSGVSGTGGAAAGAGSVMASGATGAGSTGSSSSGGANPQVALSPGSGSLAFTGPPVFLPWLVGMGILFLLIGGTARLVYGVRPS